MTIPEPKSIYAIKGRELREEVSRLLEGRIGFDAVDRNDPYGPAWYLAAIAENRNKDDPAWYQDFREIVFELYTGRVLIEHAKLMGSAVRSSQNPNDEDSKLRYHRSASFLENYYLFVSRVNNMDSPNRTFELISQQTYAQRIALKSFIKGMIKDKKVAEDLYLVAGQMGNCAVSGVPELLPAFALEQILGGSQV